MHFNQSHKYAFIVLLGLFLGNSLCAADNAGKQQPVIDQPAAPPAPPVIYDSPAPPPEPPRLYSVAAPPPKIPSLGEWLKTETVKIEPNELAGLYRRLLTDKLMKNVIKPAPDVKGSVNESEQLRYDQAAELAERTARQGYLQAYSDFIDADGSFWLFEGMDNAAGPDRLLKVGFPNPRQYVVQMSVRCAEVDAPCRKLADKYFKSMAVPPPRTHSQEAGYQWLQVRSQQPCLRPGPVNMRAPAYPAGQIKDEKEKEISIRFATDACGVPISVKIHKSSGNRTLDKTAIDAVWKWRVKLPENKLTVPLYSLREFIIPLKFMPPVE